MGYAGRYAPSRRIWPGVEDADVRYGVTCPCQHHWDVAEPKRPTKPSLARPPAP